MNILFSDQSNSKISLFNHRSVIKEQVKLISKIICDYNESEEDLREEEEMTERREQCNRQVTWTHELEICQKTRDVVLKQVINL